MTQYVLGIDGGGTSTRAVILNDTGKVCGSGKGGASKYDDVGFATARENIRKTVELARIEAGFTRKPFGAVFLGIGGVASEADRQVVRKMALELNLAQETRIGVDHDIRIALAGGLSGRPGIVQIAGTGASTYGRNPAGESWRSGGWGPLISDEGSGYWLGIQAMRAATRAADGRSQPTMLLSSILSCLEISDIDKIMDKIYAQNMSRAEIAALGPLVIDCATKGDPVSLLIVNEGAQSMAECITVVAQKLGMVEKCELTLSGGVFQAGDIVIDPLRKAVEKWLPNCAITKPELPPVIGAGLLALEVLNIRLTPEQLLHMK